jgi:hypothetical protein
MNLDQSNEWIIRVRLSNTIFAVAVCLCCGCLAQAVKQGKTDDDDDDGEFNNAKRFYIISKKEKWRRDVVVDVVTTL